MVKHRYAHLVNTPLSVVLPYWTQAPSIQVSNGDSLSGVASISSTEAWAVGFSAPTPTKTLAFHFK
jgi:hypothetical protein